MCDISSKCAKKTKNEKSHPENEMTNERAMKQGEDEEKKNFNLRTNLSQAKTDDGVADWRWTDELFRKKAFLSRVFLLMFSSFHFICISFSVFVYDSFVGDFKDSLHCISWFLFDFA